MTAGDGLDREAVRRRAEAATPGPWKPWTTDGAGVGDELGDVPALLDALEAAEAREDALRAAIRLADALRTEGGASCDHIWHEAPDTHCAKGCGAVMPATEGGAAGCCCADPESSCGGADSDPGEPGFCGACASLDGEEHCLRCPFECCTEGGAS